MRSAPEIFCEKLPSWEGDLSQTKTCDLLRVHPLVRLPNKKTSLLLDFFTKKKGWCLFAPLRDFHIDTPSQPKKDVGKVQHHELQVAWSCPCIQRNRVWWYVLLTALRWRWSSWKVIGVLMWILGKRAPNFWLTFFQNFQIASGYIPGKHLLQSTRKIIAPFLKKWKWNNKLSVS